MTNVINYNSETNQQIKSKFIEREVIHCVSPLVFELAQQAEAFPSHYDDLLLAYCTPPDYKEAALEAGWKESKIDEDSNFFLDDETSCAISWEELCNQENIDTDGCESEVLEHWIVSDWLASELEKKGERILYDFFGLIVWGRSCSGQAIMLDGVISEICSEMEILAGQTYEWKV